MGRESFSDTNTELMVDQRDVEEGIIVGSCCIIQGWEQADLTSLAGPKYSVQI